jgi:glycogen(starch) synthase
VRLLFISSFYPPVALGGYELECHDVAERLRALGHEVSVLTSSFRSEQVRAETEVWRLLKLRWKPAASPSRRPSGVARNRFEVDLHNGRTARRLIERIMPDVAVIFNAANLGRTLVGSVEAAAQAVAYRVSDEWLVSALEARRTAPRHPSLRTTYEAVLAALDIPVRWPCPRNVAFNSQSLRTRYEMSGFVAPNTTVIHPGVPSDLFAIRPQHLLQRQVGHPFRILYVGRICAPKGVATLIEALGRLRSMPGLAADTRLTLVGQVESDSYREELRRLIARLGVSADFAGPLIRSALPAVYAEHDVFAFPSEWEEPFGLSLVEAMAIGLPVVTTLRGGAAEIVRPGQTATTFRPGDAADLANKLSYMLSHPSEAAAMGRSASADVVQRFSISRYAQSLEAFLGDLNAQVQHSAAAASQPA